LEAKMPDRPTIQFPLLLKQKIRRSFRLFSH